MFEQDLFDKYSDDKIREALRFIFEIHLKHRYNKHYLDRHFRRLRVYYKGSP